MAHCFRFSAESGRELDEKAPIFSRKRNLFGKLVRDNDAIVQAGRFETPAGEQELPLPPATDRLKVSPTSTALDDPRFDVTEVCVANIDTVSASLLVGDATALNFANAYTAGGGYRR